MYRADTGKLLTAHRAHSGDTVTCYRIVRANLPQSPPPKRAENGAGAAARDKSPCPPDLMVVTAGQLTEDRGDGGGGKGGHKEAGGYRWDPMVVRPVQSLID